MGTKLRKIKSYLSKYLIGVFNKKENNNTTNNNIITMNQKTLNDINKLTELITECSGYSHEELVRTRKNRKKEYVRARQVHMSLLFSAFPISYEKAGRMFYDKDHATVMHAIKSVNNDIDTDKEFREQYQEAFWFALTVNPKKLSDKIHIKWMLNS